MSWFDSAGISSFAKIALKEAQKTIDKALDINEAKDELLSGTTISKSSSTDLKDKSEDFFASHGVKENETTKQPDSDDTQTSTDPTKNPNASLMVTSLWGSFTGSFFENKNEQPENEGKSASAPVTPSSIVATQPPRSISGLAAPSAQTRPPDIEPCIPEHVKDNNPSQDKKEDWNWGWDSNISSINPSRNLLGLEKFASLDVDPREESLVDDCVDTEGFSRSRLVVGSVDSDSSGIIQRCESQSSLSGKSFDLDMPHSIPENVYNDPFDDSKSLNYQEDMFINDPALKLNLERDKPSEHSSNINAVKTPDSIVVLSGDSTVDILSSPDLPTETPSSSSFAGLPPLNLSNSLSSPDSIELIDSDSIASPSIEVLSGTSTIDSSPTKIDSTCTLLEQDLSILNVHQKSNVIDEKSVELEQSSSFNLDKENITDITITRQPMSSLIKSLDQENLPPSQLDDISTNESIQSTSTSSTHTVIEGSMHTCVNSQKTGAILDDLTSEFSSVLHEQSNILNTKEEKKEKGFPVIVQPSVDLSTSIVGPSPASTETLMNVLSEKQSIENCQTIPVISQPSPEKRVDRESDCEEGADVSVTLTSSLATSISSVPLDVSMESGGSSDTITASMDSFQLHSITRSRGESECDMQDYQPDEGSGKHDGVKSLLKEAMGEVEEKVATLTFDTEHTSSSSSDKSGKVNSGPTSSHSSGDEVETTASSDIELISSPSLDGVSNYARSSNTPNNMAAHKPPSLRTESPSSDSSNRRNNGSNNHETVPSSMTTSFTSISESEGEQMSHHVHHFGIEASRMAHDLLKDISYYEKGHRRNQSNFSETSDSSSELQTPDVDKLLKKIAKLTEILEARENKVMELSQQNAILHDVNMSLKSRTEELECTSGTSEMADSVREEFTQRLATMERKFQQALREKETIKKQLEDVRAEASTRLSSAEVNKELEERDTIISELRQEGEKLSKQQLTYSNTIKKLRNKERENETTLKTQKNKLEEQSRDLERLRKQLSAKEEVERNQIEAIRQLTIANQQQEINFKDTSAENAELEGRMTALKDALECAYREVGDLKRAAAAKDAETNEQLLSAEMAARQQAELALTEFENVSKREKETLIAQISDLQESLNRMEQQSNRKEKHLKAEISDLQKRLTETEIRTEELSGAVSSATRPLLKQLETLQSSHSSQQASWEALQENLSKRLNDSQAQAASSLQKEHATRELYNTAYADNAALLTMIANLKSENIELYSTNEILESKIFAFEENKNKTITQNEALKNSFAEEVSELKKERDSLEQQLDMEKTATAAEKKKSASLQDQIKERDKKIAQISTSGFSHHSTPRSSPTPSLSRVSLGGSVNESFSGSQWGDEVFESSWQAGSGRQSLYESLRGSSAVTVDALTSQLRQREGELSHMQTEVSRLEVQKSSLAQELISITSQLDDTTSKLHNKERVQEKFNDMERQYNALLQMYGEKVEEVEELRLDLTDVKDMYKAQIDQLLQK